MHDFCYCFRNETEFTAALEALKKRSPIQITGVCENAYAPFCCSLDMPALVCVAEEKDAYSLAAQLCGLGKRAFVLPSRDCIFENITTVSREWEQQRISVLRHLIDDECDFVIAVPDALMLRTMPPSVLIDNTIILKKGDICDPQSLCERLTELGYSPCDQIEGKGQFSRRGGIVDVYSPECEHPFRVDFFGDEIDSISYFDVLDQRSFRRCDSVTVVPAAELLLDFSVRERIADEIGKLLRAGGLEPSVRSELSREHELLSNGQRFAALDKYFSLVYEKSATIFDYMTSALVVVAQNRRVHERATAYEWEVSQAVVRVCEREGSRLRGEGPLLSAAQLESLMSQKMISLDVFATGGYDFADRFEITAKSIPLFGSDRETLIQDIGAYISAGRSVTVACANSLSFKEMVKLLNERDFDVRTDGSAFEGTVSVTDVLPSMPGGFELTQSRFVFLCESAASQVKALRRKRAFTPAKYKEKIVSYADLSVGDLVVHENHGIGRYDGISKLTVDGVTKDYIKIHYQGSDVLYVPCSSLDLVSKYIGADSDTAKLSKLGGTDWYKAKQRAKKSAKNIASELIALYGERMKRRGYAFGHDDELQREFEEHFEYVETYGQLKASEEIKKDMESIVPMDRLLCGDVGFGKTEVALRAVFKCVRDGKQAAVLVPTTILAWQHYNTMLARFRSFPVNVEMISRFRTRQQQQEILKKLHRGEIDVIVGTHRLLQKDVSFKDLGLLIVDEEQRFGVTHKEKLKQLATNVDVLTLTATPIPRTLNMALSGIRDMSVLEEAPQDRLPVQTYVLEYDDAIVNEAIKRELRRGGQVFFLHNDIDSIYTRAAKLQEAFPDAAVDVGHGKMTREQLSEVWESLVRGDTDILVCTTIIETGVDVPNANTLIIENADRLGLSQLHQIRGRVGRSPRKAYAYLTVRPEKALSEIAEKRLEAVREFTEFGSGFKIAMRDLELRGAGNLLGAEQHGNIESVGYDLFIRILEDAVAEEKGEPVRETRDCVIDVSVDAYIPETYVTSPQQRIDIYRKIALIADGDECTDLQTELVDRYGTVPRSVHNLMEISLIRNVARSSGIEKITSDKKNAYFYLASPDPETCAKTASSEDMRGRLLLSMGTSPYLCLRLSPDKKLLDEIAYVVQLYTEISHKLYGQNVADGV